MFLTVSDFFLQKIAARCSSGTFYLFFSIFSKLSGIWRGTNALRRCPTLQGAGHGIADFGVIWGRFFSDQKSTFSISIKRGLAGVWTYWRSKKIYFADFFFSLGRCNGAGQKKLSRIRRPERPQKPPKHQNFHFFLPKTAILGIVSRKRVIFD